MSEACHVEGLIPVWAKHTGKAHCGYTSFNKYVIMIKLSIKRALYYSENLLVIQKFEKGEEGGRVLESCSIDCLT